jgi:hypothetical protein
LFSTTTFAARIGDLRAHRRRQPEAHRAHAARGQPQARSAEIEHLRGPHLMLTDAGGDDRIPARAAVDLLDHEMRLHALALAIVVHGVAAPELRELGVPCAEIRLKAAAACQCQQAAQCLG